MVLPIASGSTKFFQSLRMGLSLVIEKRRCGHERTIRRSYEGSSGKATGVFGCTFRLILVRIGRFRGFERYLVHFFLRVFRILTSVIVFQDTFWIFPFFMSSC